MNPRLLPPQKATVSTWMQQKEGKLVRIIDRTCRYHDAIIEWQDETKQPDGSTLFTIYQTRLELTPTGKIRCEESEFIHDFVIPASAQDEDELPEMLPLEGISFVSLPPRTIVRNYLYPRERTKTKAKFKPRQFALPLSKTESKLQSISLASGDKRIYSAQELLQGTEEFYSLNWGVISLPKPFIFLLKSFRCSIDEWESIAQLSLVLNPQQLLPIIEDIPAMRSSSHFSQFKEPVAIENHQAQSQSITQKVKVTE